MGKLSKKDFKIIESLTKDADSILVVTSKGIKAIGSKIELQTLVANALKYLREESTLDDKNMEIIVDLSSKTNEQLIRMAMEMAIEKDKSIVKPKKAKNKKKKIGE